MRNFPIFYGEKIILRELKLSDTLHYFNYMTDPSIQVFFSDKQKIKTLSEAKKDLLYWSSLFNSKQGCYWAITFNNHELIGTIGFHEMVQHRATLSYDLNPLYWNQKIMSEALDLLLKEGLSLFQIKRIQATVAVFNKASIALLEKHFFKREGLLFSYEKINDVFVDYYLYSFLT